MEMSLIASGICSLFYTGHLQPKNKEMPQIIAAFIPNSKLN